MKLNNQLSTIVSIGMTSLGLSIGSVTAQEAINPNMNNMYGTTPYNMPGNPVLNQNMPGMNGMGQYGMQANNPSAWNPNMYGMNNMSGSNQPIGNPSAWNPNMYGMNNMSGSNQPIGNPSAWNQNMYGVNNMSGSDMGRYGMNTSPGWNQNMAGMNSMDNYSCQNPTNSYFVMKVGEIFGVVMTDNPAMPGSGMWTLTAMPNCLILRDRFSKPFSSEDKNSHQEEVFVFQAQTSCRADIWFTRRSEQGVMAQKSYQLFVQ